MVWKKFIYVDIKCSMLYEIKMDYKVGHTVSLNILELFSFPIHKFKKKFLFLVFVWKSIKFS